MTLAANAITLVVEGRPEDNGDVRLEDFVHELDGLLDLLTQTDIAVNGRVTLYYKITDLRHQSPSTVVLEPVLLEAQTQDFIDFGARVAKSLINSINGFKTGNEVDPGLGNPVLDAYRVVSSGVGPRVGSIRLLAEGHGEATLSQEVTDRVTAIVTRTAREVGSVTGHIEKLNIHGKNRNFYVFPNYGPRSVRCTFPRHLRDDLIKSVGRYATVYGTLIYRGREKHAELMVDVTRIELHPLPSDLPDILALRGTMPGVRGGVPFGW